MLSNAFTWENANILAVMSRDAYLEPKEFKKKYKKAKFIEADGTQCYVWPSPAPAADSFPIVIARVIPDGSVIVTVNVS